MKTKILKEIKRLRNQREESEKEISSPRKYSEGWEDGYDDALDIIEEFVEDLN